MIASVDKLNEQAAWKSQLLAVNQITQHTSRAPNVDHRKSVWMLCCWQANISPAIFWTVPCDKTMKTKHTDGLRRTSKQTFLLYFGFRYNLLLSRLSTSWICILPFLGTIEACGIFGLVLVGYCLRPNVVHPIVYNILVFAITTPDTKRIVCSKNTQIFHHVQTPRWMVLAQTRTQTMYGSRYLQRKLWADFVRKHDKLVNQASQPSLARNLRWSYTFYDTFDLFQISARPMNLLHLNFHFRSVVMDNQERQTKWDRKSAVVSGHGLVVWALSRTFSNSNSCRDITCSLELICLLAFRCIYRGQPRSCLQTK